MKKLLIALWVGFVLPSFGGSIIVRDTWSDGTRTDPAPPVYSENGTDSDSDGDIESAWFDSSGAMTATTNHLATTIYMYSQTYWTTYFTPPGNPVTLTNAGEQIKITWAFTPTDVYGGGTGTPLFALGVVHSPATNYLTADDAPASATYAGFATFMSIEGSGLFRHFTLASRTDPNTGTELFPGGWTEQASAYNNSGPNGIPYTFVMTFIRNVSNGLDIISTLTSDSGIVNQASFSDASPNTFAFDTVSIFGNGPLYGSFDTTLFQVEFLPTSPPEFYAQPVSRNCFPGNTVTFSACAGGSFPLSYQWTFNGTNIDGGTNVSLTLTNVQFVQAGNYAVLVTNIFGSILSSNAVLTVNSPPPCVVPPAGLISWWRAESNALDSAGINHGVLMNGATFAAGEVGQAFLFDGVDDYISIPDSPALGSLPSGITIEAWIKVNKFDREWQAIVTKGYSSWRLARAGNTWGIGFGTSGLSNEDLEGKQSVNDGQWHHVAGVYDGTNKYIYVDGVLDVSTPAAGSISQNSQAVCIGEYSYDTGRSFNGQIDEVSIYSRALSSSEIQTIYNARVSGKCLDSPPFIFSQPMNQTVSVGNTATIVAVAGGTPPLRYQWSMNGTNVDGATNSSLTLTNVQFSQAGNYAVLMTNAFGSVLSSNAVLTVNPPLCAPPPEGLVSWWRGEGNASDGTGTNHGTLMNGATFAAGEVGQAFFFDGVDDYISISDSPSLHSLTTNITIEVWIKVNWFNPGLDWTALVTKGDSSWQLRRHGRSSHIGFSTSGLNYGDLEGSRNIDDGQWHHVAAVYDGNTKYIYVDGMLDAYAPATGSIAQNDYPICIGENAETMWFSDRHFNGMIDEVSIYNRSLSASEIQTIYNASVLGKCVAPVITVQPTNQTVLVGSAAAFTVAASGMRPLSYQWNLNGTNLVDATNTMLLLTSVTTNQAGGYSVTVTNMAGTVTSSNAILSVYVSATPTMGAAAYTNDRQFQFEVNGVPGFNYAIEASTNLADWVPVFTNTSPFTFLDTTGSNAPLRFYRAVWLP